MEQKTKRKGIKEWFRKIIVTLKKRPQIIPLTSLVITYIVYSFNLTSVSNTTAVINKQPMGICSFIVMLFSLLAMVAYLNAYPKRAKPRIIMIILFYFISAIVLVANIIYLIKVKDGMSGIDLKKNAFIYTANNCVFIHLILESISILLSATLPLYSKLLNLINTSVDLGESTVKHIDVDDE